MRGRFAMREHTEQLVESLLKADKRAAARLITQVENESPETPEIISRIYNRTGNAHIIGITGAPGVGKSTLVDKLTSEYRKRKKRVGIIAVDPTSPYTGGALLGDRIRMGRHNTDEGVFIRSMGSRGHAGGIARATADAAKILDALGMDIIFIETVGAGQSEVAVAGIGDTLIVVTSPGLGDDIQFLKAGILEIGDIFVVNKGDMDGADDTAASLEMMLCADSGTFEKEGWKTVVLKATAKKEKDNGVSDIVDAIDKHGGFLHSSGLFEKKRLEKCRAEVVSIAQRKIAHHISSHLEKDAISDNILKKVAQRKLDPYSAAEEIMKKCGL